MLVSPFPLSPPHTPASLTLPPFLSPSQASLSPSSSLPQLHSSSVLFSSNPLTPPAPPPSVPRTRPVVKMTLVHTTLTQVLTVVAGMCGPVYLTSLARVKTLCLGRSCSSLLMKNLRMFTSTTWGDQQYISVGSKQTYSYSTYTLIGDGD